MSWGIVNKSVTPGQMEAYIGFTECGKHIIFITTVENIVFDDNCPWVNVADIYITSYHFLPKVQKLFYHIAAYISVCTGYQYFHYMLLIR